MIKMNIFPCVNCPFVFLFSTNSLCPLPTFLLDCLILLIYRVCAMSFNLLFWEVGQIRECKICLYNHISYSYWRPTTALILVGGFPWPRPKRSPYPQGLTTRWSLPTGAGVQDTGWSTLSPLGPCEGLTSVPSADDSPAFTPGHFFPGPPPTACLRILPQCNSCFKCPSLLPTSPPSLPLLPSCTYSSLNHWLISSLPWDLPGPVLLQRDLSLLGKEKPCTVVLHDLKSNLRSSCHFSKRWVLSPKPNFELFPKDVALLCHQSSFSLET